MLSRSWKIISNRNNIKLFVLAIPGLLQADIHLFKNFIIMKINKNYGITPLVFVMLILKFSVSV